MLSESDEFIVPMSRVKLSVLALGSVLFVGGGAWLLTLAREEGIVVALVGLAAVLLFGMCGAYAVTRLLWPVPAVVVNREGIFDNASLLGVGFIAWNEIAEVGEYRFKNQVFVGIVPKDLDALLARLPAWKGRTIRANVLLGAAPVNIPQVGLPMKASELLEEIEMRSAR